VQLMLMAVVAQWGFPSLQCQRDRSIVLGLWGHSEHGEYWFSCHGVPPYLYYVVREGSTTTKMTGTPDQCAWRDPTITE
jgi:hypothetical protein